jgi:CRP-like cAMP-binding protein
MKVPGPTASCDEIAFLRSNGWLARQKPEFRSAFLRHGRFRSYQKGSSIYEAGDSSNGVFGLANGSLHIVIPTTDEDEVVLSRADPGFWIGDLACLADKPRLVSVRALTPCRVFHVPARGIRTLAAEVPGAWAAFYELTYANMAVALAVLSDTLAYSPERRALRTLSRLATGVPRNEDGACILHMTQGELAALAGVSRPTIQRLLRQLGASGILETNYKSLRILSLEKLCENEQVRNDR